MNKNRLEAFSDGVLAIIVTIMVLELKVPEGHDFHSLTENNLIPKFISYVLSFIMVWIYWNNHHHTFQCIKKVDGKVLLANGFLLFWLSLIPFTTAWMGKSNFAQEPVILTGIILFMSGTAYYLLIQYLIKINGKDSLIAEAIGKDKKGIISEILYAIGIGLSFIHPLIGFSVYVIVAIMWLVPDRRIEKLIEKAEKEA